MAPPLIFLVFVIGVAAVIAIGLLVAARTGLWVRETSTDRSRDELPTRGRGARGTADRSDLDEGDRPEHVTREDPTKARTFGT